MFFFGLASNIFTLGIFGVFSLIFLYQGLQHKIVNAYEENTIEFCEKFSIESNTDLINTESDFAEIIEENVYFTSYSIQIYSYYFYSKTNKEVDKTLTKRGPPSV